MVQQSALQYSKYVIGSGSRKLLDHANIINLEETYYFLAVAAAAAWRGSSQHVKVDLNKKLDPKQKTIQIFTIDAQGFRKTKNENPLTWEIRVTS